MKLSYITCVLFLLTYLPGLGQPSTPAGQRIPVANGKNRWSFAGDQAIVWPVSADGRLPHQDHIEMSGRTISAIIRYSVDTDRKLTLRREIYWPMLRVIPGPTEPEWAKYRAY